VNIFKKIKGIWKGEELKSEEYDEYNYYSLEHIKKEDKEKKFALPIHLKQKEDDDKDIR